MRKKQEEPVVKSSSRAKIVELSYTGPYKKAIDICAFYGVKLIDPPKIDKETTTYTKKFNGAEVEGGKEPTLSINERAAMIREYAENEWDTLPQPVLVMYTNKPNPRGERFLYLHAIGITKSIADMLSIHLAWTILHESGVKDSILHLNTIGDKDSSAVFIRELTAHYRKHINGLPDDARESFKENILNILKEEHLESEQFQEAAPRSINFLNEKSRRYFKEVVEFAEASDIPYIIDSSLVENREAYSETIFDIRKKEGDTERVYATGARSDNLTRGVGMRKLVPIISTTILVPNTTGRESIKKAETKKKKPAIFFIRLGDEARLRSFGLLEKLRKAKLPVSLAVGKDTMSSQLQQAERLKVPITLIIGQKEALDSTVILRDMKSRSQETVALDSVVEKVKELLKK